MMKREDRDSSQWGVNADMTDMRLRASHWESGKGKHSFSRAAGGVQPVSTGFVFRPPEFCDRVHYYFKSPSLRELIID
ncbi:hypothetical protein STEG23_026902, partial [Scotinomys teguina]